MIVSKNFTGVLFLLSCTAVLHGLYSAENTSTIAEIQISDRLLRSFNITTRETTPFNDNGARVHPNITVKGKPRFLDSGNGILFQLDLDVNGSATSDKTQNLFKGRREAGATVFSTVTGTFTKQIRIESDGISAGPLRGAPKTIYFVETHNNLRVPLLRQMAHRKAAQQAHTEARARIPYHENRMVEKIRAATDGAVSEANEAFKKIVAPLKNIVPKGKKLPLQVQVKVESKSSDADQTGFARLVILDMKAKPREPRPLLSSLNDSSTSIFVHEDVIREQITPLLAGKKVNLGELHNIICGEMFEKILELCNQEMDPTLADAEILFSEVDPFNISFDKNQILLRLNVAHRIGTVPYKGNFHTVEVAYDVSNEGLKRRSVKILAKEEEKQSTHWAEAISSRAKQIISSFESQQIKAAYSEFFKEHVEFPVIQLPGTPQTTQRPIELKPKETKSENGWFASTATLAH